MSGVNSVVLVGRLTRDVEVRKTASGISYARFTVACDRRYSGSAQNNGAAGQQQTADFISCVAWRQRADFLGSYGRKGTMISVEGSIQTGSYTDRDGRKVYTTDVAADNVSLLSPRSSNASQGTSYSQPEPQEMYPASSEPVSTDEFNTGPTFDIASDDLPF